MKVLQINSFFTVGGPPRIVNGIYDTLIETGNECKIAASRADFYIKQDSIKIGSSLSPYINAILCRVFDSDGFNSKRATKKLIKQIEEYNPDVIHLHNLHGYYINVEILFNYLKTANKKVVWTLHDCWSFTGHCTHFSQVGCDKWKIKCNNCPQKKVYPSSYVLSRAEQNFLRKREAFTGVKDLTVVTPSNWLKRLAEISFLGEYDVISIPNGIDLNVFKPTQSNFKERFHIKDKKIVLGVAQNWGERKGFNDFIELSKKLDSSYRVVLVGVTAEQKKLLPPNVLGIERTNSVKELAEIYTVADVFVNLSVEETMGLVTAEALACGTPAVVYNKTAVPEVVDEKSGIVVEAGDINGIVNAIKTINFKSEDCILRAQEYEKTKKYNEYLEIYKR